MNHNHQIISHVSTLFLPLLFDQFRRWDFLLSKVNEDTSFQPVEQSHENESFFSTLSWSTEVSHCLSMA